MLINTIYPPKKNIVKVIDDKHKKKKQTPEIYLCFHDISIFGTPKKPLRFPVV